MDRIPQDKIDLEFKAMTRGLVVGFSEETTSQAVVDSILTQATRTIPEAETLRYAEWRAQSINKLVKIHADLQQQLAETTAYKDIDTLPDVKSWPIVIKNIQTFTNYVIHTIGDPQENDLSRATAIAQLMVYQQEARKQIIFGLIPSAVLGDSRYTQEAILDYIAKHNGLTDPTIQLLLDTFADGLIGDIEDALEYLRT